MNKSFLFKHWISTILLAPLLMALFQLLFKHSIKDAIALLEVYLLILLFSVILSIPTAIIYYVLYRVLENSNASLVLTKASLIFISILGIVTTIFAIGGTLAQMLIYSFSISAVITGSLLKIKVPEKKHNCSEDRQ